MKSDYIDSSNLLEACYAVSSGTIVIDGARCTANATRLNGYSVSQLEAYKLIFLNGLVQGDQLWSSLSDLTVITWSTSQTLTTAPIRRGFISRFSIKI